MARGRIRGLKKKKSPQIFSSRARVRIFGVERLVWLFPNLTDLATTKKKS
jgi:hypothetical protein